MVSVLFRVEAGQCAGLGHLRRCLVLAGALRRHGFRSYFAFDSDNASAGEIVEDAGFRHVLAESARDAARSVRVAFGDLPKVSVLDIVTGERLAEPAGLNTELMAYREAVGRVVLIDGSDEMSLRNHISLNEVDLIVAPYVGEAEADHVGAVQACLGTRYYLLPPCWIGRRRPSTTPQGRRVLVTAGGSDPVGLSVWMLDSLEAANDRRLEIRVVIGPYFGIRLRESIAEVTKQSDHDIEVIHQPSSLVEHMLWCDVALANSGLTKYELAATGTPSILLSIDRAHAKANKAFDRANTALDLGWFGDTSPDFFAGELVRLLDDSQRRTAMMQHGRRLIDGQGANRVAAAVLSLTRQTPATRNSC